MTEVKVDFTDLQKLLEDLGLAPKTGKQEAAQPTAQSKDYISSIHDMIEEISKICSSDCTEEKKPETRYAGTIDEIFNFVNSFKPKTECCSDETLGEDHKCCKDQTQEKPRERSKELKIEQTIENSVLSNLEKLELLKSDFDNLKANTIVPEIDIILSGFFYKIEEFCDLLFCLLDTGDGVDYIERISIFLVEAQKFADSRSRITIEKDKLRKSGDITHQLFLNLYIQYTDTLEIIYSNIKSDLIEGLLDA